MVITKNRLVIAGCMFLAALLALIGSSSLTFIKGNIMQRAGIILALYVFLLVLLLNEYYNQKKKG